ncbi:MAG: hypothetical protein ABF306_03685 [Nocardioides marinisabuli]|uniref:hypothetical protein n=1 Tax=Nocardioides marinisabuli TaxID=419476 RepID=UPI00321AB755
MLAGGELRPPADYDERWLWGAALAVAAVVVYYVVVLWLTRSGRRTDTDDSPTSAGHLSLAGDLDALEAAFKRGSLNAREASQRLSRRLRAQIGHITDVPAETMTLAQLRLVVAQKAAAPGAGAANGTGGAMSQVPVLVAAIEMIYPAAFAPAAEADEQRFVGAMRLARQVSA